MASIKNPQSKIKNPQAILLAAGKGTRMGGASGGNLPKVLHPVAGRPMIHWVVEACRGAGVERVIVVVGYRGDLVQNALADAAGAGQVEFVEQAEQRGTAHAVAMAAPLFKDRPPCDVFVLAGDGPLIRPTTLQQLLITHRDTDAAATLATAILDDPTGYGRVLRTPGSDASGGGFDRIVEQKDATPDQLAVREVNPSYYCFDSAALFDTLEQVGNANASGEYYLTDVPGLLAEAGRTVSLVDAVPPQDVLSINTLEQLSAVDAILRERLATSPATDEPAAAGAPR